MIQPPVRLRGRPQFHGMPVPYSVFVSEAGIPDFRVNDMERMAECVARDLCVLCGQRLGRRKVFTGGPASIENGAFFDGPMHEDCARYAITICPFLSGTHGQHADDAQVKQRHEGEPIKIKTLTVVAEGRPEKMGLYFTFSYTWSDGFYKAGPAIRVEWY